MSIRRMERTIPESYIKDRKQTIQECRTVVRELAEWQTVVNECIELAEWHPNPMNELVEAVESLRGACCSFLTKVGRNKE